MKKIILITALAMLSTNAFAISLGPVVSNADGTINEMTYYEAGQYCQSQGTRLPTSREYAVYSQSLGASGIRETAYPGMRWGESVVQAESEQMSNNGYWLVFEFNKPDDSIIGFYFNSRGFKSQLQWPFKTPNVWPWFGTMVNDLELWSSSSSHTPSYPCEYEADVFLEANLDYAHDHNSISGGFGSQCLSDSYGNLDREAVRCVAK